MRISLAIASTLAVVVALTPEASAARSALVTLERAAPSTAQARAVSAAARAFVARNALRRVRRDVPEVGLVTVRVSPGTSFESFARRLEADPVVSSVEPDVSRRLRVLPDDPGLSQQDPAASTGTVYQWNMLRQNLPGAWALARGDAVKVGVLDTGIDSAHPDLATKVAATVDQDAGGGGIDDVVGHGTHVAGLACGATDNGYGSAGAGSNCQLIVEKTDLTSSSVVASIIDATKRGAKVINMSFGGWGETAGEKRALNYAFRRDVVLVAAAANNPQVNQGHPAADLQPMGTGGKLNEGNGLVVTAAGETGKRAYFAGRGSQISLAAFGYTSANGAPGIFSTFPANRTQFETGDTKPPSKPCECRTTLAGDNRFGYLNGTSMAAPQVAGVAALVRSANPGLSNLAVIQILKSTASQKGRWNSELGWGIVDAEAAVRAAIAYAGDTLPPITTPRGGRIRSSGRVFKLRWRSVDQAPAGVAPSGVESYRVYAKRRGSYKLVATTRTTSEQFRGNAGARYSFYVQARDRAGNLEPAPGGADFVVRVRG
ncbi:MAG: S8 family serine peptidase [Solirubrobacterales bacterium]